MNMFEVELADADAYDVAHFEDIIIRCTALYHGMSTTHARDIEQFMTFCSQSWVVHWKVELMGYPACITVE